MALVWACVVCFAADQTEAINKALALARAHRFVEAKQAIAGVIAPASPAQALAFHRLRAAIAAGLKNTEESSREMHAALALAPREESLRQATVMADLAYVETQLTTPSRSHLAAALSSLHAVPLTPQSRAAALASAGQLLLGGGAYPEAVAELSESVTLQPGDPSTWAQLAYAQFKARSFKAALASALHAKSIADTAEVESLLGDIYEANGDSVASARGYQTAISIAPREESFRLALAVELMQHQTFAPAIDFLKTAAVDFPKSSRVQTALGLAYYLTDDDRLATQSLLTAIHLDPASEFARRYLGEIALQQSADLEPVALHELCGFADSHPKDSRANTVCGGLQARVAHNGGSANEWQAILKRLKASALAAPQSAFEQCTWAKALDEAQGQPGTRHALETCAKLDPDSVEVHFRLARVYRRLGLTALSQQEAGLRARAEQRQAQANEQRYQHVSQFLYTLRTELRP